MAGLGSDAQLKVTPSELSAKSTSVKRISVKMMEQYYELNATVKRTSAYWTGSAAESHRKKLNEQNSDVDSMFRRIDEHVKDLQIMSGVYTSTEENVKTEIQDSLPSDVII